MTAQDLLKVAQFIKMAHNSGKIEAIVKMGRVYPEISLGDRKGFFDCLEDTIGFKNVVVENTIKATQNWESV